jgi:hypothetical protein
MPESTDTENSDAVPRLRTALLQGLKGSNTGAQMGAACSESSASGIGTRARNHGHGVGFTQHKNVMAYVDADRARNQLEGGIIQSTSWTRHEQLRHGPKGVGSFDWSSYPILRFPSVPERIEVELLDQPGMPFLGVGEAALQFAASAESLSSLRDLDEQHFIDWSLE